MRNLFLVKVITMKNSLIVFTFLLFFCDSFLLHRSENEIGDDNDDVL